MLIPLNTIISTFKLPKISNVIHVGAHHGEELPDYLNLEIPNIILVEPHPESFTELVKFIGHNRYNARGEVSLHNIALGNNIGKLPMYVETANKGASNSLLQPDKHLKYYPDILFDKEPIEVEVTTLDTLEPQLIPGFTLINCDVQGFELEVLKGATKTLDKVQAIYLEVNQEELYKGVPHVTDIDAFLRPLGFERVVTEWTNAGWGDALYLKQGPMVITPTELRLDHPFEYPSGNHLEFERYLSQELWDKRWEINPKGRTYLPIHWTAYHVANNYGQSFWANKALKAYLDNLEKTTKYFTVCQYDDGPLVDFKAHGLDVMVFAMSGPIIDYPLPLIYDEANYILPPHELLPGLLLNFIGRITHPIREQVMRLMQPEANTYISDAAHAKLNYYDVISRSTFTLCPRGYGQTSFRIMEALKYGSIPVYISDEFLLPHSQEINFEDYGILVRPEHIPHLYKGLLKASKDTTLIERMRAKGKEVYNSYYTYEANKQLILKYAAVQS